VARSPLTGPGGGPRGPLAEAGSTAEARARLLRRGLRLEYLTLAWNVVGAGVVLTAAVLAGSVALTGFGVDSLIEIGASVVVVWQLRQVSRSGEPVALRLIGVAFVALGLYLSGQAAYALATHAEPTTSPLGMGWLAATVVAMVALATGKARTGAALGNAVLSAEARVTMVDAYLAGAVLLGVAAAALLGWWWADPIAGLVIVAYAVSEARALFPRHASASGGSADGATGTNPR
jgi:divalent metal cation (Fe/Co/Zn/Cd) transporter